MEKKYERIKMKLNTYETSHPFIHALWSNYLSIKQKNFIDSMEDCSNMIERLSTQPDLNSQQLITLLILNSYDLNRSQ